MSSPDATPEPGDADASFEESYAELVHVLRKIPRGYALLSLRCEMPKSAREALLARLAGDIAPGILAVVRLSLGSWDAANRIAEAAARPGVAAVAVVGLELTPGMPAATSEADAVKRPPSLATLNHGREAIRRRCPVPLLVLNDPVTYRTARRHAPDFFDHFAGLFHFRSSAPHPCPDQAEPDTGPSDRTSSADAPAEPPASPISALSFYEEQARRTPAGSPGRARALLGLAESLASLYARGTLRKASALARAVEAAGAALDLLAEADPDWARGQATLGRIDTLKAEGDRVANLRSAIGRFETALAVYSEADQPFEWAAAQNALGVAWRTLPDGDLVPNLRRAIACHEAALRVYTEAGTPHEWGATQNALGLAYDALTPPYPEDRSPAPHAPGPPGRGTTLAPESGPAGYIPDRSEASFHDLHRVIADGRRDPEGENDRSHFRWALACNDLGMAYRDRAVGDRADNLRIAIDCYDAALRVFSFDSTPLDWAAVQNNRGNAYRDLRDGDRTARLRLAINCYRSALCVYDEHRTTRAWAVARRNLGLSLDALAVLEADPSLAAAARECFLDAGRGFAASGFAPGAEEAAGLIAALDARLDEECWGIHG